MTNEQDKIVTECARHGTKYGFRGGLVRLIGEAYAPSNAELASMVKRYCALVESPDMIQPTTIR